MSLSSDFYSLVKSAEARGILFEYPFGFSTLHREFITYLLSIPEVVNVLSRYGASFVSGLSYLVGESYNMYLRFRRPELFGLEFLLKADKKKMLVPSLLYETYWEHPPAIYALFTNAPIDKIFNILDVAKALAGAFVPYKELESSVKELPEELLNDLSILFDAVKQACNAFNIALEPETPVTVAKTSRYTILIAPIYNELSGTVSPTSRELEIASQFLENVSDLLGKELLGYLHGTSLVFAPRENFLTRQLFFKVVVSDHGFSPDIWLYLEKPSNVLRKVLSKVSKIRNPFSKQMHLLARNYVQELLKMLSEDIATSGATKLRFAKELDVPQEEIREAAKILTVKT